MAEILLEALYVKLKICAETWNFFRFKDEFWLKSDLSVHFVCCRRRGQVKITIFLRWISDFLKVFLA